MMPSRELGSGRQYSSKDVQADEGDQEHRELERLVMNAGRNREKAAAKKGNEKKEKICHSHNGVEGKKARVEETRVRRAYLHYCACQEDWRLFGPEAVYHQGNVDPSISLDHGYGDVRLTCDAPIPSISRFAKDT